MKMQTLNLVGRWVSPKQILGKIHAVVVQDFKWSKHAVIGSVYLWFENTVDGEKSGAACAQCQERLQTLRRVSPRLRRTLSNSSKRDFSYRCGGYLSANTAHACIVRDTPQTEWRCTRVLIHCKHTGNNATTCEFAIWNPTKTADFLRRACWFYARAYSYCGLGQRVNTRICGCGACAHPQLRLGCK